MNIFLYSVLSVLCFSSVLGQYGPEFIGLPPAFEPPAQNIQEPNLRAPPIPSWIEKLKNQEKENDLINESSMGSGLSTTNEDNEESLLVTSDTDGSGSGEGGGEEDFDSMMSKMDKEAAVTGANCPVDVIFLLDATSSVREVFEQCITYISKVIEGLDISETVDRVGVIVYSSELKQRKKIELGKFSTLADLQKAVRALPFFSGITATGKALSFAAENSENRRNGVKLNYIVLTDGYSYDDIDVGAKALQKVPNSTVYAVSVGNTFLKSGLEMIAGSTKYVFYGPTTYGSLVKEIKSCPAKQLFFQSDNEPETVTVRYIPTATDSQGRNIVPNPKFSRNRITHFNDKATHREIQKAAKLILRSDEFIPPTTEEILLTTDCKYDIGFIFDASGSLFPSFKQQLQLANKLVDQLPLSANNSRIAIVQFAGKTRTKVLKNFQDSLSKSQVKKLITFSNFYSGTTFTNQALLKMETIFKKSEREGAKKKLIIFTDGYSAEETIEGIERLKSLGVMIYTVGISQNNYQLNVNELESMASSPEHFFDADSFKDLLLQFPSTKYC